ncbi:MAG: T9SS type A sorting domain-containing protein [Bacteroidales bacterium]|nr:T9SS type A sorting domain-containing protein [Bacteroidales bacterium]
MKKFLPSVFFFLMMVTSVSAQWTDDPLVNTIVNNLTGSQAVPHIAYDATGNFYIGFYSNETGNYNIRLQYYNFAGVAQWDDAGLLVSDHTQNSWVTDWALTTDNSGNCVLAFNDVRNGNVDVFAYAISPAGTFLWGTDGITLTTDAQDEYVPSITVTSANNVIVAWQRPTATKIQTVMQKISPAGTLLWGSTGVTYQNSSFGYTGPRVLGVENDQFLLAFYKETGNFPALTRHIYVQKFNTSGAAVWSNDVLVCDANGISAFNNFTIASDNANGIVLAWTDDRNSDNNINAAINRVLTNGTTTWPADGTEVTTQSNLSNQSPRIVGVNSNNEVIVTWSKKSSDQNQTAISGQKFSANGVAQWTNTGIDFVAMNSMVSGSVGGDVYDGTNAMIVYEEYVSSSAFSHIKALGINNAGVLIWSPANTLVAGRTTGKSHHVLSRIYNDQLISAWEEGSDGSDIYMQNINTDGSIGEPPISNDATLIDLTVNGITVNGFDPEVYLYDYPVPTGDPVPVTGATANFPLATVNITQAVSVPGNAVVLVTAEDGVTQHTYTVNFYVAGTDHSLADLTVNDVTIPGFSPAIFTYDYTVPTGDPIPVVGATATDIHAEVDINQAIALPGVATVEVTSEDGLNSSIYTVNFLYTPSTDATLEDILLNGASLDGFEPNIFEYDVEVIYDEPAPYTMGVPTDPNATVGETQCPAIPGDAVLVVTAEDGLTSLTYTVHFAYVNYDASLSDLTVDGITITGFDPATTSYQYQVENGNPIPVIGGTANDPLATLTISQATEIPGQATIVVLAVDGVHETTYSVYFYTISNIATLLDLKVDGVTVEGFDPAINYYEVDVLEGSAIPVITASTTDPQATMVITQATAVPGDGTVVVTAEDGITQFTYTVHFNLITGIEVNNESSITIFPNPVEGKMQFKGLTDDARIEIVNMIGNKVVDKVLNDNQFVDISYLPAGIYFARILQSNSKIETLKFIKR